MNTTINFIVIDILMIIQCPWYRLVTQNRPHLRSERARGLYAEIYMYAPDIQTKHSNAGSPLVTRSPRAAQFPLPNHCHMPLKIFKSRYSQYTTLDPNYTQMQESVTDRPTSNLSRPQTSPCTRAHIVHPSCTARVPSPAERLLPFHSLCSWPSHYRKFHWF